MEIKIKLPDLATAQAMKDVLEEWNFEATLGSLNVRGECPLRVRFNCNWGPTSVGQVMANAGVAAANRLAREAA